MEPRHFAAYEDSVFRHYIHFGPHGVDLPTFEHILSQWDKKRKKFIFTDRNDGEEIACSFNHEWIMEHTWFSNEGLLVDHNRDRKNRIWSRFFNKLEIEGARSIAPPNGSPTRRNMEQLLLKLGPAAVDAGRGHGPRHLHKNKRGAEDDIPIDAVNINEDIKQPNEAVEKMEWPQQVIYWKSIASMNQALRRDKENKFKFSGALNKRKRGAKGVHAKVSTAAPLKGKTCKRTMKPSKWVVTPYTKGKKKKEKDNIRDKAIVEVAGEEEEQVQEKVAELAPARLQSDHHSI
ncbi:uncharacterized protein A4U43_C07F24490 [Asparagus officinalis]|uniref:Uncharacterized protein n=1 Tax=Asparagus officinalis TaxID=4686 RepID=A0A5P1EEW7_ASPOF|nr:uncharacterized protein A4U43_C07F24490 [Asparagus officinalis]